MEFDPAGQGEEALTLSEKLKKKKQKEPSFLERIGDFFTGKSAQKDLEERQAIAAGRAPDSSLAPMVPIAPIAPASPTTRSEVLDSASGSRKAISKPVTPASTPIEAPKAPQAPGASATKALVAEGLGEDKPGKKEATENVQQMYDFIDKYDKERGTLPGRSEESKALRKALKDAYEAKITRNEWLEVGQTLAQAVAQGLAAQSGLASPGKYGNNMSGLQFATTDYGKRMDRAGEDYRTELKDLSESLAEDQDTTKFRDSQDRDILSKRLQAVGEALREESSIRNAEAQAGRAEAAARRAEDRADRRSKEAENKADERFRQQNNLELARQDQKEAQEVAAKAQAKQQLLNAMFNDADLSKKDESKVQAQYGDLAAKAGVPLAQVKAEYDAWKDKQPGAIRSMFGAKGTDPQVAVKSIAQAIGLGEDLARIQELRRSSKARLEGAGMSDPARQSAPAPVQSKEAPVPEGKVKVIHIKSGKPFIIDKADLQEALTNGARLP